MDSPHAVVCACVGDCAQAVELPKASAARKPGSDNRESIVDVVGDCVECDKLAAGEGWKSAEGIEEYKRFPRPII
jgi:hypothetical protein